MIVINTILIAIDGLPLSRHAFEQTLTRVDPMVVALHVINLSDPGHSASFDTDISTGPLHSPKEWYERADELADDTFDEFAALVNESEIEPRTETLHGNPVRTIVDFARRKGVDATYLDGRGRTGETDLLFGGVAELVASCASTGVLVVR